MKKRRNKNFRAEGFTPVSNKDFAVAMRELRSSNAARPHAKPEQKKPRSRARRDAIIDELR